MKTPTQVAMSTAFCVILEAAFNDYRPTKLEAGFTTSRGPLTIRYADGQYHLETCLDEFSGTEDECLAWLAVEEYTLLSFAGFQEDTGD